MDNGDMKKCPYCAEMIKAEAIKCRYCGSVLAKKGIEYTAAGPQGFWHRVNQGKKIAGVCTGLAQQFDSPVMVLPLRVFFVVSTLFYAFGPILYILLWILMPAPTEQAAAGQPGPVQAPGAVYHPPYAPQSYGPQPPPVDRYPGQAARPDSAYAPPGMYTEETGKAGANSAGSPDESKASPKPEEGVLDLGRSESEASEPKKGEKSE